MTEARTHAFPALDGMRGVAAVAVVFHHFPPIRRPELFHNGLMAVDIFFLLSGFVIAYAYDDRLAQGFGVGRFMAARVVRLWPIMALGVAAGLLQALVSPVEGKDLPLGVGARLACAGFNLFILPCPPGTSALMFPPDPPEWSLFYELIANLLYALAFAGLLRTRALAALIAAGGVVLILGILRYQGLRFGLAVDAAPYYMGRVVFSFFLGVLMQRTWRLWAGRLPPVSPWLLYVLLLGLLAIPKTPPLAQMALHAGVVLVVGPLLVMLGATARPEPLARKASAVLGEMSYPLFAIHMPLMFLGMGLAPAAWRQSAPAYVALVVVVVGLAAVLPRVYDAPIRRMLGSLRPPAARPAGAGRLSAPTRAPGPP